MSALLNK
jgi:hypothetical protein